MLSHVGLRNFKAFDELELDLYPITLLLGPNNSGKSSILAPLRILSQTVESPDPQVPLLLNGIMGDFGTYKDIVYGNHRGRPLGLSVSVKPRRSRMRLPRSADSTIEGGDWPSADADSLKIALEYKYRVIRRELILRRIEVSINDQMMLATAYSDDSERQLVVRIGDKAVPSPLKSSLSRGIRMQHFIPNFRMFYATRREGGAAQEFLTKELEEDANLASQAARAIGYQLQQIDYVGAMRLPPERTYRFTGERRARIGRSGENAAGMLMMDSARGGARSLGVLDSMKRWLAEAGIASDVRIEALSDRHYEIRVQHPVTGEYQNLADVGQGNSQVLPVLVGGLHQMQGATFVVEEPEIHLHPRAQAELGDFFIGLYRRGVQSIVETHSEYLIVRLQQHVARKTISPEHVRIYYVYAEGGKKQVSELRMDGNGRFLDEWPEGFFPQRLEEAKKLSRIRFRSESAEK